MHLLRIQSGRPVMNATARERNRYKLSLHDHPKAYRVAKKCVYRQRWHTLQRIVAKYHTPDPKKLRALRLYVRVSKIPAAWLLQSALRFLDGNMGYMREVDDTPWLIERQYFGGRVEHRLSCGHYLPDHYWQPGPYPNTEGLQRLRCWQKS